MKENKFLLFLILSLIISPVFATSKLATTEDGEIFILKDNNTYEKVVPKTFEENKGYQIENIKNLDFLDIDFNNITLTELGNYLPSSSPYSLGSFTTGKYFLLEMKTQGSNLSIYKTKEHEIPDLILNDKSIVKGNNERIQLSSSSSAISWYTKKQTLKNLTYSVLYEIPEGKTPINLNFKNKDNSVTTLKLGTYKTL